MYQVGGLSLSCLCFFQRAAAPSLPIAAMCAEPCLRWLSLPIALACVFLPLCCLPNKASRTIGISRLVIITPCFMRHRVMVRLAIKVTFLRSKYPCLSNTFLIRVR